MAKEIKDAAGIDAWERTAAAIEKQCAPPTATIPAEPKPDTATEPPDGMDADGWEKELAAVAWPPKNFGPLPKSVNLLLTLPPDDTGELLRHRVLCRGGAGLFVGSTGTGKSSFMMNAAMRWACGAAFLDMESNGPMRILIIQAENDDYDTREHFIGVHRSMQVEGYGPEKIALAMSNLEFVRKSDACGVKFTDWLDTLLTGYKINGQKPDIVIIDPAFTFIGASADKSETVTPFLRNMLNPVIFKHNIGCIMVHHTNKPPKDEPNYKPGDFPYMGAGSAEWANWARFVLFLQPTHTVGKYCLIAGKRGRFGWKDDTGELTIKKWIQHHYEDPADRNSPYWWKTMNMLETISADLTEQEKKSSKKYKPPERNAADIAALIAQECQQVKLKGEFIETFQAKHSIPRNVMRVAMQIALSGPLSENTFTRPKHLGGGAGRVQFIAPQAAWKTFDAETYFIGAALKHDVNIPNEAAGGTSQAVVVIAADVVDTAA